MRLNRFALQSWQCEVIVLFGDRVNPPDFVDDGSSQPLQAHEDLVIKLLDETGAGVSPVHLTRPAGRARNVVEEHPSPRSNPAGTIHAAAGRPARLPLPR